MSWILMLKHATISSGIISSFQGVLVLYQRELLSSAEQWHVQP